MMPVKAQKSEPKIMSENEMKPKLQQLEIIFPLQITCVLQLQ